MEFLAPFHPQITHVPIVLIPLAFLFELAGRALDRDWWRKAALATLVAGVIGAWLSVQSGHGAEETADKQGVPQEAIDEHEEMATLTLWLSLAALAARAVAARTGRGAPDPASPGARAWSAVVIGLGLALHLAASITVAVAAHRGGRLVFEHGANVRLHSRLIQVGPPRVSGHEAEEHRH